MERVPEEPLGFGLIQDLQRQDNSEMLAAQGLLHEVSTERGDGALMALTS